jgi:hypothetical protein
MQSNRIRGRIDSYIEHLNQLSQIYPWVPNAASIRPKLEHLEVKNAKLREIAEHWGTMKDYILHGVFGQSSELDQAGKKVCRSEPEHPVWAFCPSSFRYDIPEHANHYVLWYSGGDHRQEYHEEFINCQIQDWIYKIVLSDEFDFAWYKNPKPTVPEFYHVQVFWIRLAK